MDVHIETQINAPADKVWDILGRRFAEIAQWASVVESSRAAESSEVPTDFEVDPSAPVPGRVTTTRLGTLTEILVKYSDDSREFIFKGANLPPIFSLAQNHSRIVEQGPDQSVVMFDITIEPRSIFKLFSPVLRRRFNATWGGVQRDLKRYAESS